LLAGVRGGSDTYVASDGDRSSGIGYQLDMLAAFRRWCSMHDNTGGRGRDDRHRTGYNPAQEASHYFPSCSRWDVHSTHVIGSTGERRIAYVASGYYPRFCELYYN
jgi:hypothetical protein